MPEGLTPQHRIRTRCDGLDRRSIPVYHRFMHIAHDSYMSKVSAFFRPAVFQSGMYIRSRMSSHLILNVVYLLVCQKLTSYLTSLKTVIAETVYSMRDPCAYYSLRGNGKQQQRREGSREC